MMDCAHYRRAVLADPHASTAELKDHLAICGECPAFTARLLSFEGRLARALKVPTPAPRAERARSAPRLGRGWLAMAASVLVAVLAAGGLWLAQPHESLAADVVAHMAGEPDAWTRTTVPVPAAELSAVLDAAHLKLRPDAMLVSYAQSCLFRGHHVPHLVVQTENGPITVMVLVHESVAKTVPFDENGYHGMVVPDPGHGSLAVLARSGSSDLQDVEGVVTRVERAIVWTP